jgi:hypothetical protein
MFEITAASCLVPAATPKVTCELVCPDVCPDDHRRGILLGEWGAGCTKHASLGENSTAETLRLQSDRHIKPSKNLQYGRPHDGEF